MSKYISCPILVLLFWGFSLLGVLIEGVFCLIRYKHWETHTVTLWGPFCIIYGMGATCFYIGSVCFEDADIIIKFLIFSIMATVIEYLSGFLLKYGLRMKAWDYSKVPFNFQGIICVRYSIVWGLAGVAFAQICSPYIKYLSLMLDNNVFNLICAALSAIMAIDLLWTFICIVRWSGRHRGIPAQNALARYIDKKYDDSKMSQRFCEWEFIDF